MIVASHCTYILYPQTEQQGDRTDGTEREVDVDMKVCGAYNLAVPKRVIMEENPAYGQISRL